MSKSEEMAEDIRKGGAVMSCIKEAWQFMNELYELPADNRDQSKIERGVYQYTDCGAWIEFNEHGIKLGSIVEGSEADIPAVWLSWEEIPLVFTEVLVNIDKKACDVWDWANEVREDGMTDEERGMDCPDGNPIPSWYGEGGES